MQDTFKKNGVEEFSPLNEKFNPLDHEAIFKYPDDSLVSFFCYF